MLDNNNKIVYGITSATQEEVSFTAFDALVDGAGEANRCGAICENISANYCLC